MAIRHVGPDKRPEPETGINQGSHRPTATHRRAHSRTTSRRMCLKGVERHRRQCRTEGCITSTMHHQIGVVPGGIRARAVDEQHLRRIWRSVEVFQILQEPGPVAEHIEGGGTRREPVPQTIRVRGLPILPVVSVCGRIGEESQPDQELEATKIEIRARSVGPENVRTGHLPGRNHPAHTVLGYNGNPIVVYQV